MAVRQGYDKMKEGIPKSAVVQFAPWTGVQCGPIGSTSAGGEEIELTGMVGKWSRIIRDEGWTGIDSGLQKQHGDEPKHRRSDTDRRPTRMLVPCLAKSRVIGSIVQLLHASPDS